ncbi:MAG: ECF-type sigma factor [Isosphaeraceae bacterium]|nr:ECF-type sigma factor [Isosphaeraceae bacterium]
MADVTQLLDALADGDANAGADLLPLVYAELRRLAAVRMGGERPGQTLDATALVHEAYLRLVGHGRSDRWAGRGHFFAAAAEAMRRLLIEAARRKHGAHRGGGRRRVAADLDLLAGTSDDPAILDLDEALDALAAESPVRAELVKLRFFAGLTMSEAAQALGVSVATAERYWAYARARLYTLLADSPENP